MSNQRIEQQLKINKLASDLLKLSRNTLLVNLRFLDAALAQLIPAIRDEGNMGTDGKYFIYNPRYILTQYKQEKEVSARDYLHSILHCIFRHMYVELAIDKEVWNLSCDIAVEAVITELDVKSIQAKRHKRQIQIIRELKDEVTHLTAEKIYRYYIDNPLSEIEFCELQTIFYGDDHDYWYMSEEEKNALGLGPTQNSDSYGDKEADERGTFTSLQMRWKDLSESLQQDLETFSKHHGSKAESLTQNLKAVNREKYDYTEFLKKFAVLGEAMKINDDEFDYIFYTYGLKLYKKMPLVEPLEYKEVKAIKEFVIAIDTSGSTAGELVQTFLQKTYNVLKSAESFFTKMNLHIIQCDAEIQEHVKITRQAEFDEYIKNLTIRGLGGTDFRPVFRKVDELIRTKEFTNLKGLIYFTDGCGDFPAKKPDYNTAFVFIDDNYNNPEVPPWAIKLVLQKDEI